MVRECVINKCVINIETQHSCVEVSSIAHFIYQKCKNNTKILWNMQHATYATYANIEINFSYFHFVLMKIISIEDFSKMKIYRHFIKFVQYLRYRRTVLYSVA